MQDALCISLPLPPPAELAARLPRNVRFDDGGGVALFAVLDGHGGAGCAQEAAARLRQHVQGAIVAQATAFGDGLRGLPQASSSLRGAPAIAFSLAGDRGADRLAKALADALRALDAELKELPQFAVSAAPAKAAKKPPVGSGGAVADGADSDDLFSSCGGGKKMSEAAKVAEAVGQPRVAVQSPDTSGTTVCLVAVTPTHFISANIGDSRAVLIRDARAAAAAAESAAAAAEGGSGSSGSGSGSSAAAGEAVPGGGGIAALALTEDHKAATAAERQRALAAGATVSDPGSTGESGPVRITFDYAPQGSAMAIKMGVSSCLVTH